MDYLLQVQSRVRGERTTVMDGLTAGWDCNYGGTRVLGSTETTDY